MNRRGFSLVELMIIIAIMGILASIAAPVLNVTMLKARRAEAHAVLDGVGTAEIAYFVGHGVWVDAESNPGSSLGKTLRPFDPTMTGWDVLGFAPDGDVRCNYMVNLYGSDSWARSDAYCDVDDDNQSYILRNYIASDSPEQTTFGYVEVNSQRY